MGFFGSSQYDFIPSWGSNERPLWRIQLWGATRCGSERTLRKTSAQRGRAHWAWRGARGVEWSEGGANERAAAATRYAAEVGYAEIVKLLLNIYDIDVTAEDINRRCALYIAVYNGHTEVARLLIYHPDANVNKLHEQDFFHIYFQIPRAKFSTLCHYSSGLPCMTILWLAWSKGHFDIVKLLLDHPNISVSHGRFENPFSY